MGLVTQQDPIGIAGGLNLYGYANGDPINFSDPFGLDPCKDDPNLECPDDPGLLELVQAAIAITMIALIDRDVRGNTVSLSANTGPVGGSLEFGLDRLPSFSAHANAAPEFGASVDVRRYFDGSPIIGSISGGANDHLGGSLLVGGGPGLPTLSGIEVSFGVGTPAPINARANLKSQNGSGFFDWVGQLLQWR